MGSERKRCVAEGRRERTHAWKGNANKGSHSGDANLHDELFLVIKGCLSEASVDVCAILVERGIGQEIDALVVLGQDCKTKN